MALGVVRITASTPGRSMHSSRFVDECGIPHWAANAFPLSAVRLLTETTSTPSSFLSAFMWMTPIAPVPAKQILITDSLPYRNAQRDLSTTGDTEDTEVKSYRIAPPCPPCPPWW